MEKYQLTYDPQKDIWDDLHMGIEMYQQRIDLHEPPEYLGLFDVSLDGEYIGTLERSCFGNWTLLEWVEYSRYFNNLDEAIDYLIDEYDNA